MHFQYWAIVPRPLSEIQAVAYVHLFLCGLFYFFSGICRCETDTCAVFTPHKEPVKKLALSIFSKDTNAYC